MFNQTSKKEKQRKKRRSFPNQKMKSLVLKSDYLKSMINIPLIKYNKSINVARLQFKPTGYLLTGLLECSTCKHSYFGTTSFHKGQALPYIRYTHFPYTRGKCRSKDLKIETLDNWSTKIVIPDIIRLQDIRRRTKEINAQIIIEKKRIQTRIDELNQKLSNINQQLENQAKDLVKNAFSLFALEDVASLKDQAMKITLELSLFYI
jgi:hypothetical protein